MRKKAVFVNFLTLLMLTTGCTSHTNSNNIIIGGSDLEAELFLIMLRVKHWIIVVVIVMIIALVILLVLRKRK